MADLIVGKWYVLDKFAPMPGTVAGPFESKLQAELERQQLNIADDCTVRRYDGRPRPGAEIDLKEIP